MAGADGVAVACLAVDLLAAMLVHGIVANDADTAAGREVTQAEACQQGGKTQSGPACLGQDTVVAGGDAADKGTDGAQQVGDGSASGSKDSGDDEELDTQKGGSRESGCKFDEQRQGIGGYTGHRGLLACKSWVVG
jgi:hypothetical protein